MPKIHVLSSHIANQIAAGEVVDRPCSIVKELVENAVDAGANNITVETENGGIDLIRVTDNGSGISDEDSETAFLRHATSKIEKAGDLAQIATLGFRGEALASIAAVSMVSLTTHTKGDPLGTKIRIEGGELKEHKRIGCPEGTVIEVRSLFYHTPARLKFLKSPRAESGAIGDYMARLILSMPQISFHYISGGKTVYRTNGDGNLKNALVCIYGVDAARNLCPIAFDDGYMLVEGFVGTPELSRPNRSGQTFVLNGRVIRSTALSSAVIRAFDTRLLIGRYPFCMIRIQLALNEVDVNVHPSKLEVRFADEPRVARSVCVACADALARNYVPSVSLPQKDASSDPENTTQESGIHANTIGHNSSMPFRTDDFTFNGKFNHVWKVNENTEDLQGSGVPRFSISEDLEQRKKPEQETLFTQATARFDEPFTIVGCVFQTYWIIQQGDGVYLMDQHAAHERLLYDALTRKEMEIVSQPMLYPEKITLIPSDFALYEERKAELTDLGFLFSQDAGTTVTLAAVPQINGVALGGDYLLDALHTGLISKENLTQTACKHAVKGGELLKREQVEQLLKTLSQEGSLLTCPHGRPVAIKLTKTEIEKMFKRIV